jgi:DNA-binding transcriptional ArsR family regulator
MVRIAGNPDIFAAVAEPRRRAILDLLAEGERQVNDVVATLGIAQPQVSKHLRVLKDAGLVRMRQDGRRRLYRVHGEELKAMHAWLASYEKFWDHQLDRVKERAERTARRRT